jgi:Phage derived protein Gp49-like (DUF891)
MDLHVVAHGEWLVVAPAEHRQVMARLRELAKRGGIADERKVRHLSDGICELKTRSGIRVLYFVEESRVVVCTDALRKPKPRPLAWLVSRSRTVRVSYVTARRARELRIVEE